MTTNEEIALLPKWAQEIYGRKWGNTIPKMLESWASALAENAILRRIAEAARVVRNVREISLAEWVINHSSPEILSEAIMRETEAFAALDDALSALDGKK